MNIRTLAFSALALAALAPAAFAGPMSGGADVRNCVFLPHSAHGDGTFCDPFTGGTESEGLKAAGVSMIQSSAAPADWVTIDTRGASRN